MSTPVAGRMVYRLEFASSLTVATSSPVCRLAVRPSFFPRMSHCFTTAPDKVNSTIVLSRFPSRLAWPCGPTPFWNAVNRWPSR